MRGLRRAGTRRPAIRAGFVLALLVGALGLAGSSGVASADTNGTGQAFALGSSWTYTNVEPTGDWFAPGFDTSGWTTGDAPFSDTAPGAQTFCGFPPASSPFAIDSTIYLRHSFTLPDNAFGLHVVGTIDNNADTYVNGTDEGTVDSGNCVQNAIDFDVASGDLNRGPDNPNVVAVQAVDEGVATYFDMQATYGTIQFGQQPSEAQKGSAIAPAPTVTITGPDGNPVAGATVDVSLQTIAGGGTLSGDTEETTDASGVATFSNVSVSDGGEYALVATSEGATVTSDPFLVADQITPCTGSCSASGSSSGTTVAATASNAGGSSLAVSVYSGTPPSGVCDNATPLGATSVVNFLNPGSSTPNLDVIWTLDKSLVMQAPNPGAAHFDICLGAENLQHPDGTGVTPWTTKDGTPATPVADPVLGVTLFWGLVPDCSKGTPAGPCIRHRSKNAGNEVIDVYKPYPWDGRMYGD